MFCLVFSSFRPWIFRQSELRDRFRLTYDECVLEASVGCCQD